MALQKRRKTVVKRLRKLSGERRRSLIIVMAAFGLIGTVILFRTFAAGPFESIELENGNRTGSVALGTDTNASGGQFVTFGSSKVRYEAEAAQTNAQVVTSGKDYASGGAVLGAFGEAGKYVTFTVNVPSAGSYATSLRYAAADGTSDKLDPLPRALLINGSQNSTVNFARTASTENWNTLTTKDLGSLPLNSGSNTITFRIDISGFHYWDVDYLEVAGASGGTVTPPTTPPPTTPPPSGGNGVGGSGADMTPGRKCAASGFTNGATVLSSGGNLQNAINSLGNGGKLVVNAGTYGAVTISGKTNITICGAPGSRPIINSGGGVGISINSGSEVHIEGFEIAGNQGAGDRGVGISGTAHHVHVWDMRIHDMGSAGISASNGYCGHVDIRYNSIWNTSYYDGFAQSAITIYEPRNCGGGADLGPYSDFIIGNIAWHNGEKSGNNTDGNCIIWDDTEDAQRGNHSEGPYSGRALIANNLCVSNGNRGVHIGPTSAHADVVNNTNYYNFNPEFISNVSGDPYVGDTDSQASSDVKFINNVAVARPGKNGFDVWSSSNIVKSNNIFNRVTRDESGSGGYQIIADPGFVNPTENSSTWDFRPRSGSPLINAGIGSHSNVIIPKVDITGKARSSSTPSIGAYEP